MQCKSGIFIAGMENIRKKHKGMKLSFIGEIPVKLGAGIRSSFGDKCILCEGFISNSRASVLGMLSSRVKGEKYSKVKPLYISPPNIHSLKVKRQSSTLACVVASRRFTAGQ